MHATAYPVHVDAALDQNLNRWLWLVKWALAIPHYILLAFLWMAFVVLSVVAGFAILFTGRYPHSIFEFNVGVLRWTWRVAYYTYGALGTDRYPPFTLAEVPDYPAHLEVDYPEHLSRGLVLVKWWLLAIPHYLVIGFFVGGGLYLSTDARADEPVVWGTGLIGLLVVIAAVVLLFTGRYPQQIFDLVLGMNRWVLRVAAYAGLMTDRYPPFRLDMGGAEPATTVRVGTPEGTSTAAPERASTTAPEQASGAAPGSPAAERRHPGGWTTGRVVAVVVGSALLLFSGGLIASGAAVAIAGQAMRDGQGFVMSGEQTFATGTHALVSTPMELRGAAADDVTGALLGETKLEVASTDGQPVFVGIAAADDVAGYLAGTGHATLVDLEGNGLFGDLTPQYRVETGGAPAVPPAELDIWAAQAEGTGTQTVRWDAERGDWTVVVMNADGGRDVAVEAAAGATFPALGWVVLVALAAGITLLLVSLVLVIGAVRSATRADRATGQEATS